MGKKKKLKRGMVIPGVGVITNIIYYVNGEDNKLHEFRGKTIRRLEKAYKKAKKSQK